MQCEDNSKLRIPLSEVCKTTDIGCVPITNGKPTYTPQSDELPIAFDPSSTTLWLFSCKTHDWVAFQKFKLDQLSKMNLDNIRNICEVLNIAVWYDSGSAHVQGTVTLAQFGEELLKCIQLKTRTLIVEDDTVKVWVDGLDKLPPYFIKGNNIWFEGGSGTETDPLRVATYDPICKWPVKSRAQVDAANVKHLGACLDGKMSRVPFPPEVCELPSRSEAQVRASANKQMIACIDGEGAKVPFPKEVCELDGLSQEQVDASTNKTLIACVNGKGAKVPYIESDPPICELPLATISQVSSNSNATMAVCLDGKSRRMPIPSGMFAPEYICVPKVTKKPTSPPDFGTGPVRIGCNNELYVWLCNEKRWEGIIPDHNTFTPLDPNDVANINENLRIAAWYPAGSDECAQNVYITINQLFDIIGGSEMMKEVIEIIASDISNICKFPVAPDNKIANASVPLCVDGSNTKTSISSLATVIGSNPNTINAVTNSSTFTSKVNNITKNSINNDTDGITTLISNKVAASGKVQTPICSLSSVNSTTITSAGDNAKVTMCVDGTARQASIASLGTSIAKNSNFLNTFANSITSDISKNIICSASNSSESEISSNWANTSIPICVNGNTKKINVNTFTKVINDRYVPPADTCKAPYQVQRYSIHPRTASSRTARLNSVTLTSISNINRFNKKVAVFNWRTRVWDVGNGVFNIPEPTSDSDKKNDIIITITNPSQGSGVFTCPKYYYISLSSELIQQSYNYNNEFSVCNMGVLVNASDTGYGNKDKTRLKLQDIVERVNLIAPASEHSIASWNSQAEQNSFYWNGDMFIDKVTGASPFDTSGIIGIGQSVSYILYGFTIVSMYDTGDGDKTLTSGSSVVELMYGGSITAEVKIHNGLKY